MMSDVIKLRLRAVTKFLIAWLFSAVFIFFVWGIFGVTEPLQPNGVLALIFTSLIMGSVLWHSLTLPSDDDLSAVDPVWLSAIRKSIPWLWWPVLSVVVFYTSFQANLTASSVIFSILIGGVFTLFGKNIGDTRVSSAKSNMQARKRLALTIRARDTFFGFSAGRYSVNQHALQETLTVMFEVIIKGKGHISEGATTMLLATSIIQEKYLEELSLTRYKPFVEVLASLSKTPLDVEHVQSLVDTLPTR